MLRHQLCPQSSWGDRQVKGQLQSHGISEERRVTPRAGSTQPPGKAGPGEEGWELPGGGRSLGQGPRQRQEGGRGAEAGRSVYLQSWRRAATQQSWQEISQTGVRGLGAGPSRAAPNAGKGLSPFPPGWVTSGQPHSGLNFPAAPQAERRQRLRALGIKASASPDHHSL